MLLGFTGSYAQSEKPVSSESISESIQSTSLISKVDDSVSNNDDTGNNTNTKNNTRLTSDKLVYNIFIKTDKSIYLFALSPEVAVHLTYPDYNKKEDFTQWYNSVQYHEPVMSDIEMLSDKKTVHAQLTYYPHLDSHDDMQKVVIYGQRIDGKVIDSSGGDNTDSNDNSHNGNNDKNNTEIHDSHASIDVTENAKAAHYHIDAFMLGFDSDWNTNDMNLRVDDNEQEVAYKRWHDPVKHLEKNVHNATQDVISPFGLLFCHAPCLPGG